MEEEEDVEEEEQEEAGEDADDHGSMDLEQPGAPDDTAAWQAGRRTRRPLDSPLDMNLRYATAGGGACSYIWICALTFACLLCHPPLLAVGLAAARRRLLGRPGCVAQVA